MCDKEQVKSQRAFPASDGDRIMISGTSGIFPNSENVREFSDNLYNKVGLYPRLSQPTLSVT